MKASITIAIAAPITSAIQARDWLKWTCASAQVLRYINPNMTRVKT